ncbi:MAG TPA: hypothetical protein PLT25_04840 [Acidocella sp.]|nr:hypothetical protein [Acidocella sp.]
MSQDMVAGNWRLHGWWMAPDNYIGLDELVFAAVWAVTHNAVLTIRLAAIIAWIGLGIVMVILGAGMRRGRLMGLLVLLAMILIPNTGAYAANFYFNAPLHVLTVMCIFLVVMIVDAMLARVSVPWGLWFTLLILTTDAAFSDPFFIYVGALPIVVALMLMRTKPGAIRLKIVSLLAFGVAMAKLLVWLNQWTGGFTALPLETNIPQLADLFRTAGFMGPVLLSIFGCVPLGGGFFGLAVALLRLPLICFAVVNCYRMLRVYAPILSNRFSSASYLSFIDITLCLIIVFDVSAVVFGNLFQEYSCVRFFLPAWVAVSILAARHIIISKTTVTYFAVVSLASVVMAFAKISEIQVPVNFPSDTIALVDALEKHHLRYGYAGYWQASDATIASGGAIVARAFLAHQVKPVSPYRFFAKSDWYEGKPEVSQYFIAVPNDKSKRKLIPVLC